MREVFVTVGPRASGKSQFCEKAITLDPTIALVSRDQILMDLFGKTLLDPYTGGHIYCLEKLWETVESKLTTPNVRMILDTWNGYSADRSNLIRRLGELGADQISAWYFVTPVDKVEEWFWSKPGVAKMSEMGSREEEGLVFFDEDSPRRDYQLFHKLAKGIDDDGFDEVVRINPLIVEPKDVLTFQASLPL